MHKNTRRSLKSRFEAQNLVVAMLAAPVCCAFKLKTWIIGRPEAEE